MNFIRKITTNKITASILISISLFANLSFAIEENSIASEMKTKINSTTNLLQNKNIIQKEKIKEIFSLFDPVFDYVSMSKISLGKNWRKLSSEQKKEFEQVFTLKLKQSYIDKLQLYTDEEVLINKTEKVKKSRIKLYTKLIGKDEDYDIVYKFHKSKKGGEWLIYDVEMIGVSIMKTYRKQFSEFLATNSFEDLLKELNTKTK